MLGPNEMRVTGIYNDHDLTDRLGELSVPSLFVCGRHGSPGPRTPPGTTAWCRVPNWSCSSTAICPTWRNPSPTSRHCATSCDAPNEPK
jgi:hypothetical protein